MPAGLHDGLPVGLMIVGRHLADGMCLRVAHAYERLPRPARCGIGGGLIIDDLGS